MYAEGVRLIALRSLGDAALADDVAQEAITRAIVALGGERGAEIVDLGGFVYGIARHLITDVHRSRGRTVPLDSVGELAASHVDALSEAVTAEEGRRVRDALLALSPSDREVLRLSFFDGLQPDEIARRTGQAAVNIRKQKSRALERLRRAFCGDKAVSR